MIGSHEDWGDTVSIESRGWRGVAEQNETQIEEHTEYDKQKMDTPFLRVAGERGRGGRRDVLYKIFLNFDIKIHWEIRGCSEGADASNGENSPAVS